MLLLTRHFIGLEVAQQQLDVAQTRIIAVLYFLEELLDR
jgi:hypothetical protein